jgi:predicted metal-dependent RNase
MTAPTRDIASLLALDFIGVAYKQASKPLFSSSDVYEIGQAHNLFRILTKLRI